MRNEKITEKDVAEFEKLLIREGKSPATVTKCLRDVRALAAYLHGGRGNKELANLYKRSAADRYAARQR